MNISIKHIIKRDGNLAPYDRDRITTAIFRALSSIGKKDRSLSEQLSQETEIALVRNYGPDSTPSVEEIQDIVERILMEKGQVEAARAYIIYRNKHTQARAARIDSFEATDNIPYKKLYEVLRWNVAHACHSINDLNMIIATGKFPQLVRESEQRYEAEIGRCAARILARLPELRVIIIAGPSSSGKTTATIKLSERLQQAGMAFRTINIDNYFFDLNQHPRDEFGDYDYEAPQSLDLALINQHLAQLLAGETVKTPNYNFKTGKRTLNVNAMRLEKDELLLLDSLHGLYAGMTKNMAGSQKFKVYVETLGQLRSEDSQFMRWADNRLMRRMLRDSQQRNSQPETTLTHWHYVRRSELKNIIPFIKTADFLINSALPYEVPLLKSRLLDFFPAAVKHYQDDPSRQDAYIRAKRICELLLPLTAVSDDSCVPEKSVLREFIGGSCYRY